MNETNEDERMQEIACKIEINKLQILMKKRELEMLELKKEMLQSEMSGMVKRPMTKKFDCNGLQIRYGDIVRFAEAGRFNKVKNNVELMEGIVCKEHDKYLQLFYKEDGSEGKFLYRAPHNVIVVK